MPETDYSYTQVHPVKSSPRLNKRGFLIRVAVSIILEAGFALLCAICLPKPLLLNIRLSLSNAKASFTVISILWQLAVTIPLGDIVDHCFSGEWYFQVIRAKNLVPGRIDAVSILTAGLVDRLRYALTPRASIRFRVALMIMLMKIAIRAIVPGTLSPANVLHEEPTKVQVARAANLVPNLDGPSSDYMEARWFYMSLSRAGLVGQLEQQKVISFGLKSPTAWMVPWPSTLAKGLEGRLRYPTDLVHFNYDCKWENQDVLDQEGGAIVVAGQLARRDTGNSSMVEGNALLPVSIRWSGDSDYRVAFLFSGQNSQTPSPSTSAQGCNVNLAGLPTFNATSLQLEFSGEPLHLDAPVAALLVCDPHVEYSGGEAQLYPNGSIAIIRSRSPPIGNIDNSTEFLGNVFQGSVSNFFAPRIGTADIFTIAAVQAFLPFRDILKTNFSDPQPRVVAPLSLEEISSNLNQVATSLAKSFSSGVIIGDNFGVPLSSMLLDVDGWVEKENLVLATNPRLFWISVGLWSVTMCLLAWLGLLIDWETLKPFALDNILDTLNGEKVGLGTGKSEWMEDTGRLH